MPQLLTPNEVPDLKTFCTFVIWIIFPNSKIFYPFPDDISEDEEYPNVVSEAKHLRGDESSSREPSPLKETLMNKFSKFSSAKSQNPSINNCDPEFKSGIAEEDPDGCQVLLHIFLRKN